MTEVISTLRDEYGIVQQPITTRNPQANAMVERTHQTLGNILHTQNFQAQADLDLEDPFSGMFSIIGYYASYSTHYS